MTAHDLRATYITRKRKKWKFAHFSLWPNCFEADEISPGHWREVAGDRSLILEVGAGTAALSVELSKRHPATYYVACDVKADRLYTGAQEALAHQRDNIAFVRAHAAQLTELFAPHSTHEVWLTFPDPFPRLRQAKHRLTHPRFLHIYREILAVEGILRIKTDNLGLFTWSLEQLVAQRWQLHELTFDLHASDSFDEARIMTAYERRYIREDKPILYCSAMAPRGEQSLRKLKSHVPCSPKRISNTSD